ncbi:MAG: ComEC/Rec2 family competence protein [Myxococcales bacterium]|nr:ComEC/Rec2 family competence protein [Myxococcales bacterium]
MWPWVRVAWLAVAAVAGVVIARVLPTAPWAWGLVGLAAAGAWPLPRRARLVVAVAAVAAWAAAREARAARDAIAPPGIDDRALDTIEGWIAGPPTALASATGMLVDGDVGPVWVTISGAPRAWPGDRVRVVGRLVTPRGYRDPGSPDRAQIARDRGARWELRGRGLEVLASGDRASLWRRPAQVARWASRAIARRGGDGVGNALVRAVVVGDRSAVTPATDDAWRAAGVYHALSVSGLHLAVVALVAFAALTRLFAMIAPLAARLAPRRAAAAAALPLAVGYTLVTGGQVATVRALVVVAVVLLGEVCERRARIGDALGLAALLAIGQRPSVVFDPAFELSFVAAVTLIASARGRAAAPVRGWRRAARALVAAVRTSWHVTVATAPISAWHFGQVSLGGVVGNLVAGPAFELAALPLGVIGTLITAVAPAVGGVALDLAIAIAGWAAAVIAVIARATPTLWVRPPTPLELGACAGLFGAWLAARHGVARARVAAMTAVACAVLGGSWWAHRAAARPATLRITFLDVGQGDGAVLELPDGQVWLIDAGGAPGTGARAQLAPGRAVAAYLRTRGVRAIDVAIVSHPHPDHYLGLLAVAAEVPIRALWAAAPGDDAAPDPSAPFADAPAHGRSYADVVAALVATGTQLVAPPLGPRSFGDVTVEVLGPRGPAGEAVATADPVRTVNDNSLVVRVSRGGARVLFLGDVEDEGEDALVAAGDVAATVVKVAHHGSPTSSSPALVAAARPRLAVISLGRGNRFGFPSAAVVARWRAVGAAVVRTDEAGAVTITIAADGQVEVATFDRPPGETPPPPRVIMPR